MPAEGQKYTKSEADQLQVKDNAGTRICRGKLELISAGCPKICSYHYSDAEDWILIRILKVS